MNFLFDEKLPTPLCEIMGRNKSDKGDININDSWHNYTTLYYSIFKELSEKNLRIFELGIGTNNEIGMPGASLYGWTNFFPNSYVFGADNDTGILFNTDKIKTFYCDQTNPLIIKNMWNEPNLQENFDIIIDNGLHTFDANVCFFENSIHKLKSKGYYIIENINNNDERLVINKIKEWQFIYKDCLFDLLTIPSTINNFDNSVLIIFKPSIGII